MFHSGGKILKGRVEFSVKKGQVQVLFGIFLGAMLINNFVFTTVPGAVHLLRGLSEERRGHWHGDHLHHCHGLERRHVLGPFFIRAAGPASGLS